MNLVNITHLCNKAVNPDTVMLIYKICLGKMDHLNVTRCLNITELSCNMIQTETICCICLNVVLFGYHVVV